MQTTLNKIQEHEPCLSSWKLLLVFLDKTEADNDPLLIQTILESNCVEDAIWALRAVDGKDKEIQLMAADFAESVLYIYEKEYPNDDRPRKAIQLARKYANGLANLQELRVAHYDARNAAASAGQGTKAAANAASHAACISKSSIWFTALLARAAAKYFAWHGTDIDEIKKQKEILLKYL